MRLLHWFVVGASLLLFHVQAPVGQAAIIDPSTLMSGISGASQFGAWNDLSKVTVEAQTGLSFPGHPGSGAWPGVVPNQTGTPGSVHLTKVANSPSMPAKAPYFASQGPFTGTTSAGRMHYAGFSTNPNTIAGTLGVGSNAPLADVKNIVFQIEIAEVFGYTFFDDVLPTLDFNGGTQGLAATYSRLLSTTDGPSFGGNPTSIHTWLLQWDTTTLGPISDFQIQFTGIEHSDIYGLRVDQFENFVAAPEPSSLVLGSLGLLGLIATAVRSRNRISRIEAAH